MFLQFPSPPWPLGLEDHVEDPLCVTALQLSNPAVNTGLRMYNQASIALIRSVNPSMERPDIRGIVQLLTASHAINQGTESHRLRDLHLNAAHVDAGADGDEQ